MRKGNLFGVILFVLVARVVCSSSSQDKLHINPEDDLKINSVDELGISPAGKIEINSDDDPEDDPDDNIDSNIRKDDDDEHRGQETKSNTNEPFFEWHAASIRALVFYIEHLWHHELDEKLEATGERFKKMQDKLEEFYFNDEKH